MMSFFGGFKVRRLVHKLENCDIKIRLQAAEELGNMGESGAVEPLIQTLFKTENIEIIHIRVIQSLGKLRDPRATTSLLKILYGKLDSVTFSTIVRLRAAEALGEIGDPRSIRPLLQFLKLKGRKVGENEGELISKVREAIVQIGKLHLNPLLELLKDNNEYIRIEVAQALKEIGNPLSVPKFIEALDDLNYVVRIIAAEALGVIGDESSIIVLRSSLKDVNRDVRQAAKDALEAIQNRNRDAKK